MESLKKEKKNGYTQGAWEGAKYDSNLGIKEIAQKIRQAAKEKYPKCKFSITIQRYSGGQSMDIRLMSAPFEVFETPTMERAETLRGYGTAEEKLKYWKDAIERGSHQVNQYYIKDDNYLNEKGKEIMKFLNDGATVYNYDDSDSQIDYFNTNFYVHLAVGKWDKPFIKTN